MLSTNLPLSSSVIKSLDVTDNLIVTFEDYVRSRLVIHFHQLLSNTNSKNILIVDSDRRRWVYKEVETLVEELPVKYSYSKVYKEVRILVAQRVLSRCRTRELNAEDAAFNDLPISPMGYWYSLNNDVLSRLLRENSSAIC